LLPGFLVRCAWFLSFRGLFFWLNCKGLHCIFPSLSSLFLAAFVSPTWSNIILTLFQFPSFLSAAEYPSYLGSWLQGLCHIPAAWDSSYRAFPFSRVSWLLLAVRLVERVRWKVELFPGSWVLVVGGACIKYHTTINLQRRQSGILVSQVSFDTCFDELLILWIKLVDLVSWVLVGGVHYTTINLPSRRHLGSWFPRSQVLIGSCFAVGLFLFGVWVKLLGFSPSFLVKLG
jgi:hypothetical protein